MENNETHTVEGNRTTHIHKNDELTVDEARTTTVVNGLDHAIYKSGSKLEVTKKAEHFFNNAIEITTKDGSTETVQTGDSHVHVLAGQRHEKFDNALHVDVKNGMIEHVHTGDSTLQTLDGKRYENYKTGWDRKVLGGGGTDEIKGGLTETIKEGNHTSTVSDGDYIGKAKNVTIDATDGDIRITATGNVHIEGEVVSRTNRAKVEDTAPERRTITNGHSYADNQTMELHSNFAYFNNWSQFSLGISKGEIYGNSHALGIYTTTSTAMRVKNNGHEFEVGLTRTIFKALTSLF
ncbi:hypothetical protein D9M72_369300 [compost metagenome]